MPTASVDDLMRMDTLLVPGTRLDAAQCASLVASLRKVAVDSLADDALRRRLWSQALDVIVDPSVELALRADLVRVVFSLTVSVSGDAVAVRQPPGTSTASSAAVGVVIFGFGGASMEALADLVESYAKTQPSWRIVTTTLHGVEDASAQADAQLARVGHAISGCRRVVVHAISNNGYRSYIQLLQRAPQLAERVACVIFDCGVLLDKELTDEQWVHVLVGTIVSASVLNQVTPHDPERVGDLGQRMELGHRASADRIALAARAAASSMRGNSKFGALLPD